MSDAAKTIVGVDIGGTFTDVFALDQQSGAFRVAKVPSTAGDPAQGFAAGLAAGVAPGSAVSTVVHGTTVATNALLQRKGARTGVITTRGFRDVLEMRRRDRPMTWGLWGQFTPIVDRALRLEVDERTLADGTVLTPVDVDQVKAAAGQLAAAGVEGLAIFFVNAYANPANELAALAAAQQVWPNEHITVSSQILPEIREFERASTTALNAYVQPIVGRYIGRLQGALDSAGGQAEILIVQSNGGVMAVETARRLPIRTALSGPAAGVIAGGHIAQVAGFENVITCDMGGTSFDVSLVARGETALSLQTSIDFGLVVRTPMIEIVTIGAGGGSLAHVDRGGLLQIGPDSAGADPGPACYGLGNERPTVTDANVVLGRINAGRPIGGGLDQLDLAAAEAAIRRHVGEPLGLELMPAAEAIIRVANSRMAGAIRLVSVERGHDPRRFVAMPFGGSGALHAGALIKEVGLAKALVPRFPGVTSALGCVIADVRHDFVQTLNAMLDDLDLAALNAEMTRTAAEGRALLRRSGVSFEAEETIFELDMLYLGQTHTVTATLPDEAVRRPDGIGREAIRAAFEATYRAAYGRLLEGLPLRVVNLRTAVIGRRPKFDLAILAPPAGLSVAGAGRQPRRVWVDGGWCEAAVYERLALPVGARIPGPAVLEQEDATTFVEPDLEAEVDAFGNLVIARKEAS